MSRHRQYCSSSNFAALLQEFFIERLMQQRAASPQTIASYRDTFRLFLQFAQARLRKSPVDLALADIDVDLVLAFLRHLQDDRHNCARTRNARLVAIRSFLKYAALKDISALAVIQSTLAIPMKRFDRPLIGHLSRDEIEALLAAPGAGVVFVANQAEIAAGESALRRTQSRSVQALARRIVAEHAQVNQEFIALTQRLATNLQRSATSDALAKQSVDDLARLNEVETRGFDQAYLDREVVYLQQLVKSVNTFIRSATNAELKMLLVRSRPSFILHLDQAQRLRLAIGTPEIGR